MKTVYNYLSKHPEIIRKKQGRKTFVKLTDFENAYEQQFELYNQPSIEIPQIQAGHDLELLKKQIETLQQAFNESKERQVDLDKRNKSLEEKASKYAILLSDEKSEKKELSMKYDELQSKYNEQVVHFASERLIRARKFYIGQGIAIALLLLLVWQLLPEVLALLS